MKILHRYGERIVMIYDSDDAGQTAMKRGINIALGEGMEVQLLELPEDQDPDSFVKQFGKESFDDLKKEEAGDFVDFLLLKAGEEGRLEKPTETPKVITEILEAIAHIKDAIQRQVYVQYLHQKMQKFQKVKEGDLHDQLERVMNDKRWEAQRSERREEARQRVQQQNEPPIGEEPFAEMPHPAGSTSIPHASTGTRKKPHYEKELIRLMITYGRNMVEYICSFTNAKLFEDEELGMFYEDIIERYKQEKDFSLNTYAGEKAPFPRLVGDVSLEQHSASERHEEKVGLKYEKDKNPFKTAKSSIRASQISFYRRKLDELADRLGSSAGDKRLELMERQKDIKAKLTRRESADPDDLYPDPETGVDNEVNEKVFHYKMKGER
jgi:DNA primase